MEAKMMRGVHLWKIQSQLLVAIQYGDIDRCAALFAAGADCDQTFRINSQTRPAICLGVERGTYAIVELLIKRGVSINRRDSRGCTSLHVSCEMGYDKISKLLLDNRADVNAADDFGITPLHIAARRGGTELGATLITFGADVNRKDHSGKTPLAYACENPTVSKETVQLLIGNGASADDIDSTGQTPLLSTLLTANFDFETVESLLSQGIRLDVTTRDGRAPIHIALQSKSPAKMKCIDLFLKSGCDKNICNNMGQSPIHIACLMNDLESLKMLLRANAHPNTVDRLGISPLAYAYTNGHFDMAYLLIDGGAWENPEKLHKIESRDMSLSMRKDFVKRLTNPPKLTEISRKALCSNLGPWTNDWVIKHKAEVPASLFSFLLFDSSAHD